MFQISSTGHKILGLLLLQNCSQDLWKLCQSGHTDSSQSEAILASFLVESISDLIFEVGSFYREKNCSLDRRGETLKDIPVWPDLAKFHHFGKILTAYLLVGKMLSLLWQICYIFGLIFSVANGPNIEK